MFENFLVRLKILTPAAKLPMSQKEKDVSTKVIIGSSRKAMSRNCMQKITVRIKLNNGTDHAANRKIFPIKSRTSFIIKLFSFIFTELI